MQHLERTRVATILGKLRNGSYTLSHLRVVVSEVWLIVFSSDDCYVVLLSTPALQEYVESFGAMR
jgi:hypothetical protein